VINKTNIFESIPAILIPWFHEEKPVWSILSCIKEAIYSIVNTYPKRYNEIYTGVFVDKDVEIDTYAKIKGPALIGKGCEIRHGAFIRENVIVGDNCVVGNSTELKNSVLFNNVEVPHFNYVGDSILGNYAHLGAGAKISNVLLLKHKKERVEQFKKNAADGIFALELKEVKIKISSDEWISTGLRKFGAIIGDYAEIGVNTTINPGTVLEMNMFVPSSVSIGGYFKNSYTFSKNIIYSSDSNTTAYHEH
jgi:NDP-sugar pyrophosphorylase family protein